MGYEICYHYHPKDAEGNYQKDAREELKKKVGEPFEDVPIKRLATAVMAQLARRDILIFDVEIWEYKKSKINFKETKGGIVIKHNKFLLDDESNLVMHEIQEAPAVPVMPTHQRVPAVQTTGESLVPVQDPMMALRQQNPGKPLKFVMLDPDLLLRDPQLADKLKRSGANFVVGKRYPVFREDLHKTEVGVSVFTMWDENKREVQMKDSYFINADQMLTNGFMDSADKMLPNGQKEPKLSYEGAVNETVPDIRRSGGSGKVSLGASVPDIRKLAGNLPGAAKPKLDARKFTENQSFDSFEDAPMPDVRR